MDVELTQQKHALPGVKFSANSILQPGNRSLMAYVINKKWYKSIGCK